MDSESIWSSFVSLWNLAFSCGCTMFFFLILEDTSPFWWGYWYPCFGLLVVSPLGFKALFTLGAGVCVTHSLTITYGATPTGLLVASMAAKLISSMYLWPGTGGARMGDLSHYRQTPYWLSYADSAWLHYVNCCTFKKVYCTGIYPFFK